MNKPNLYLSHWQRWNNDFTEGYLLRILGSSGAYCIIYNTRDNHWYHPNSSSLFSSKEDAMQDVQKFLDERYNVVLLTQDAYDRLSVLI
jgi:hypothetical protein